jgi:DNA-binding transcriptional LysR family regulator
MNRVSLFEMECFVAVAGELNFSRAAKHLHLSQPPLSRQIQSLEAKLETRLLTRNTRSVALTSAGRLYLEDARQILLKVDEAAAATRRAATGEVSRLRLAFVGALLDEKLVEVLNAFRRTNPQCQIHLADLSPADQLEALRTGKVDGAFIGATPQKQDRKIATVVWKREPLLVAMPEAHPRAQARTLSLSALGDENWVMVSRAAAPGFRRQFDRLCTAASVHPQVVQESDRAAAVLTMVAAGQGISLLPESVSRIIHAGVVFRRVKGDQPMLEHTFACRTHEMNPLVTALLKVLRPS